MQTAKAKINSWGFSLSLSVSIQWKQLFLDRQKCQYQLFLDDHSEMKEFKGKETTLFYTNGFYGKDFESDMYAFLKE